MSQSSLALALAGISFMITVIWGTPLLRVLRYLKIGKAIRVEGPRRHISKTGTPTMGGLMIVLPVLLITILMNATRLLGFMRTGVLDGVEKHFTHGLEQQQAQRLLCRFGIAVGLHPDFK